MFLIPKNRKELYETANMLKEIETLHAKTFKWYIQCLMHIITSAEK